MHLQSETLETAEHHEHPNYVLVYGALLALLVVSILLGRLPNAYAMNALVFTVAGIKAILVLRYFMHVKFEPWLVVVILVGATFFLVVLFIGVAPDVVGGGGWIRK
jgi:caa(3)-type oxidase subunit IV